MIRSLASRPASLTGIVILAAMLFLALAAPLDAPYDPYRTDLDGSLRGPSEGHLFGQDT